MYNYYIISFRNMLTGDLKEYYQLTTAEEIEEKAKKLMDKFFSKDDLIEINIYKLVKTIPNKD